MAFKLLQVFLLSVMSWKMICIQRLHLLSADHEGGSRWLLWAKGNQAADLCTHKMLSRKSAYCSRSPGWPPCSKDTPSKRAEKVCVWVCVWVSVLAFTRAYQRTCAPVPCCNCLWWISRRNPVAFDHFNHFLLLYLLQLHAEVEITVWLWCFDAFSPSDSTKQGGNPHVVPPSLPSLNLSSAVWCGTITEIKSLINILLFTVYFQWIYTLWCGGRKSLHSVDKNPAIMHQGGTDTNIPIMWYHSTQLGFYQKLLVKWISFTLFGSHHLALA